MPFFSGAISGFRFSYRRQSGQAFSSSAAHPPAALRQAAQSGARHIACPQQVNHPVIVRSLSAI